MDFNNIVPGMTFEKEFIVEEGDTATHFGNDHVPVFASPRLISWIEGTAIGTVLPFLPDGWETVGTSFNLDHLAATPVGMKVRVVTELTEVKGKLLTFHVKAYDEVDKICEGTHGRAIIELKKFLSRVNEKGKTAK
ncbi:MAG: thioesterase family protein [Anaerotignum sp.]|nr:thioesterase family protein [Anaerotignum sp.]